MKWTPRQLALEFKLSVIRIEAILRLKHLERVQQKQVLVLFFYFDDILFSQGYVLQEKFSREMEKLLDAGSAKHRIVEPADLPSQQQSSASQESSPSSPSDPKDMFKRRSDGNYVFSLSGVIGEPEEPVKILEERNPRETNERWKFIVADLSSPPEKRRMYVRDNDGTLRTATKMEKEMHESLYPLTPNEKKSKTEGAQKLWQI